MKTTTAVLVTFINLFAIQNLAQKKIKYLLYFFLVYNKNNKISNIKIVFNKKKKEANIYKVAYSYYLTAAMVFLFFIQFDEFKSNIRVILISYYHIVKYKYKFSYKMEIFFRKRIESGFVL